MFGEAETGESVSGPVVDPCQLASKEFQAQLSKILHQPMIAQTLSRFLVPKKKLKQA